MGEKKLKIAITGGIASGKSEVCKYLESKNYSVLYADKISKEILATDLHVIEEIKKLFGDAAYKNNKPDHTFIAEKIFSSAENVKLINSILHPKVGMKSEELMNSILKENNIVFYEAALIFEAKIEKRFDKIVLIVSDVNKRKERAVFNGKFDETSFDERMKNQMTDEEKIKLSDYVLNNNGSLQNLYSQVDEFLEKLDIE